ncbi:hypothetical protein pdam_00022419, partial [Pocillopora damicornis]
HIENSSDATTAISILTSTRNEFNRAVKDANKHPKNYCGQNGWKLIQHLKITENGLIKDGLHLSYEVHCSMHVIVTLQPFLNAPFPSNKPPPPPFCPSFLAMDPMNEEESKIPSDKTNAQPMARKALGHRAVVKLFCRATSKAMKGNLKANQEHSPDQVVLYVGSNNHAESIIGKSPPPLYLGLLLQGMNTQQSSERCE